MKIGVLTGGGDVPGMNACLKAVVDRGIEAGDTVLGIRRGWAGLLNYNLDADAQANQEWVTSLDKNDVRRVARTGGTLLHTSYTNPALVPAKDIPEFLRTEDWSLE